MGALSSDDDSSSPPARSSSDNKGGKWHEFFTSTPPYALWVLALMLMAYLMNQLDRYSIAIVSKETQLSIGYGDRKGGGVEYDILAGITFTVVYTLAGIPIGWLADRYNRRNILVFSLLFWSAATAAMGLARTYWQLLVFRFLQGIGQAGCTPLANGIITDLFSPSTRGTALGIYNFGIYTGYSLSFALGNAITDRWSYQAFFIAIGLAGVPIALLILCTVAEPDRGHFDAQAVKKVRYSVRDVLAAFGTRPALLLLCLAGSVRNGAGTVWAYQTENFFEDVRGLSKTQIAAWMGWLPLVAGSLGALLGGFISDRVIKGRGSWARVWVLIASQLVAAPFAAGALWLPTPWAFVALIGSNIVGEMWVGIVLALVAELCAPGMRVTAIAAYLFLISNVAAGMVSLVSPIKADIGLQGALLILFPGMYLASAALFFITLGVLRTDLERAEKLKTEEERLLGSPGGSHYTAMRQTHDNDDDGV